MNTRLRNAAVLTCGLFGACLAPTSLIGAPSVDHADARAQAIITKVMAAHGGAERVARMRIMRWGGDMKATLPGMGEVTGAWHQMWQLPRQVKDVQELRVNGTTITKVQVLNGDQSWVSVNGQTRPVAGVERAQIEADIYPETLDKLSPLLDPGHTLQAIPDIRVEGKPAQGVRVVSPGRPAVRMYFDKASSLLVKRENPITMETGRPALLELFYHDYKDTEGLKMYRSAVAYLDGKKFEEFTITEVQFFPKLDDSTFAAP